jgi:hypothetical protein
MRTCLIHNHVRALLYLFNANLHGDRSWPRAHASLYKQRPIVVMLTSSIRQCYFFPFASSRMVVVRWQIALYSYVSSHLAS